MRVDLLIPLNMSAEYWDYSSVLDPDSNSTIRTYFKAADVKVMLTESQGIPIAFTRELLKFDGQLRRVRDPRGKPILDLDDANIFFFLGSPTAQFDVFGNVMGYRYMLTKKPAGMAAGR